MNPQSRKTISPQWEAAARFFVENKLVVAILVLLLIGAGLYVLPFRIGHESLRNPVAVDAIPDIGENQQIVFTQWSGRSPRDVEDQVTYPLTSALMGIPGVKTVRSSSMFGFSTIYVIFQDGIDFYWSRTRVLEKLASLSPNTLPQDATPTLGPDATAMGQVFWYALEGRDRQGNLVGGWALHELRSIQDWNVRLALQSVDGVSEVASIGGYVQEYQVNVDPEALLAHDLTLGQVAKAVRQANLDIGARTLEINRVEYVIRSLGFVRSVEDLEQAVVVTRDHTPLRIRDVARVQLGPAARRGALDYGGAEVVGGVVVARFGANPMAVIEAVKEKIAGIASGLPTRTLKDSTVSKVSITPFYDRTTLIHETLGTLSSALWQQLLVTLIVVILMLQSLRSSLVIASVLPLAILGVFGAMKAFGVDANITALAGIAIAIGTMVDISIVFTENIVSHLKRHGEESRVKVISYATAEVAPAVLTSVLTTVLSFLPVFALTASEGKLFRPLAFTKSFAMLLALVVAVLILPALAHLLLGRESSRKKKVTPWYYNAFIVAGVGLLLVYDWRPLGREHHVILNGIFVAVLFAAILGFLLWFRRRYETTLAWGLQHKRLSLGVPAAVVFFGFVCWTGVERMVSFLPDRVVQSRPVQAVARVFPGLGREFMPPFDEGSFLYMPTTMPHASFGEALQMLKNMDAAITAIPEVKHAVGKLGRVQSALDPAPISMFETIVEYHPEWGEDEDGNTVRRWRDHIRSPDDIWNEIVAAGRAPGLTSAPQLMPINTRVIMLQSGMRAPLGIKVYGPTLEVIEAFGMELEHHLKSVSSIRSETVFADRIVGKPYLEFELNRGAIGRYGLSVQDVQDTIQIAVGGIPLAQTVEGRERYPVRVRYMREERDTVEALKRVLVAAPGGEQIPLELLADLRYVKGPQVIKSEDSFLTGYVLFDRQQEVSEVDVVRDAQEHLAHLIEGGALAVPAGVSFEFAGSYKNQVRSEKRISILVPLALALVFLLLYLQFRRTSTALIIFSGVLLCLAGGFVLVWLYGRPEFLALELFGINLREVFQINTVNLSVAVWVGFIALVGIATDAGVIMSTYLAQRFRAEPPATKSEIHERVIEAGMRRVRPCLMTTATTALALLPVITSTGRGADVMLPMAIPSIGGMGAVLLTLYTVPILYAWVEERRLEGP